MAISEALQRSPAVPHQVRPRDAQAQRSDETAPEARLGWGRRPVETLQKVADRLRILAIQPGRAEEQGGVAESPEILQHEAVPQPPAVTLEAGRREVGTLPCIQDGLPAPHP